MRVSIFFVFATLFAAISMGAGAEPLLHIAGAGIDRALKMPERVKGAIAEVAPGFTPWKMSDYLPRIRDEYKGARPNEAPFAVVTDINDDGINDLVVEGYTQNKVVMIAVISSAKGYVAKIVESMDRYDPSEIMDVGEKGKVSRGLNHYLLFNEKLKSQNKTYSFSLLYIQVKDANGDLSDVSLTYYYYKKGKFISESIEA